MFGGPKIPAIDQQTAGLKARQFSTNQQARPLAIFAGTQRLGSTYLGDPWNYNYSTVGLRDGKYVFATWALMHCRGPVDKIYKVIWDNEVVYDDTEFTRGPAGPPNTAPDYVDISDWHGLQRIYFGTPTQPAEPLMISPGVHPAYRNCCYSFFNQARIGVNKTTPPSVELIVGRFPKPGWWTAAVDADGYPKIGSDINPVAFLAELLQDPIFGLGLADARIDTASWNAVANTLATEGLGISPLVTRRQNMTQIVADVFSIIDAHFYTLASGKIGLNLIRTPGGGLTLLDASKLTEAPQLDPDGWAETINALTIAYSDAAQDYNEATAQYIDRGNYEITGITRTQMLQRPWITSQALAQKVALSAGARAAMPQMRVSLSARKSVGKTLIPGTAIQLTWAEQGLAAATLRVTEQTLPKPGEAPVVKLSAELDRSYLNADYFAPLHAPTFPLSETLTVYPMKVMEWPWMREFCAPQVLTLSARQMGDATGYVAHQRWPSGTYDAVDFNKNFAMHGAVVDANYPATTNIIDDGLGLVVLLDSIENTIDNVTLEDAFLDEWIVIVGNEICSAFGATLLGAGKYRLFLVRERFDTARAAHAIGAEVWVVLRRDAAWYPAKNAMETQAWKLQQLIGGEAEDLGAMAPSTFTTAGRFWRPIEPSGLAAFGDGMNPVYTTGQDVPLTWAVRNERAVGFWDLAEPQWTEDLPDTVLEFWTVGGVLKATVDVRLAPAGTAEGAAIASYTLTNADLVSGGFFGAEVSFDVRAYHRRNGIRSERYASLRVTKV